jgi:hypothetical protein
VGYGGGRHKPGVLWQMLDLHKICSALITRFPLLLPLYTVIRPLPFVVVVVGPHHSA